MRERLCQNVKIENYCYKIHHYAEMISQDENFGRPSKPIFRTFVVYIRFFRFSSSKTKWSAPVGDRSKQSMNFLLCVLWKSDCFNCGATYKLASNVSEPAVDWELKKFGPFQRSKNSWRVLLSSSCPAFRGKLYCHRILASSAAWKRRVLKFERRQTSKLQMW